MTTIPQELSDMIVDYLHDDKPSLGKCGLVCTSWLPSSRFHLFSTLSLIDNTDLGVLCALGSSIPLYVRDLHMEVRDSHWRPYPGPWFSKTLLKLPPLPAIQSLSLFHVKWDLLTLEAKERLFTITPGLKSLSMNILRFDTLGQVLEVIASAPSLERLTMGNIECQSEEASVTQCTAPQLKEITFGNVCAPVMFHWLRLWQPIPSVYSLSLYMCRSGDVRSIAAEDYLKFLGPVLHNLELHSINSHVGRADSPCHEFDLGHNVSLRSISFDLWRNLSASADESWIVSILSQIASPYIKRVTVNIFLKAPQDLIALNPPALSALFLSRGSVFAEQATRLRFGISGEVDARIATREAFRDLHSQGRLEIWVGRAI